MSKTLNWRSEFKNFVLCNKNSMSLNEIANELHLTRKEFMILFNEVRKKGA